MPIQCSNRHENADGAAFCSTCGVPLSGPAGAPASGPSMPPATSAMAPAPRLEPGYYAPGYGPGFPPAPDPAAAARKRNLLIGSAVGVAAVLILGGILATQAGGDEGKAAKDGSTLRGIAVLFDSDGSVEGRWDACEGTGGYSDFGAGMRLSVKGKSDEIVGTGNVVNVTDSNLEDVVQAELDGDSPIGLDATTLEDGKDELRGWLEDSEEYMCAVYFEADIDPSDYYSVELGDRGDLSYSRDELADQGWVVGITLGDS